MRIIFGDVCPTFAENAWMLQHFSRFCSANGILQQAFSLASLQHCHWNTECRVRWDEVSGGCPDPTWREEILSK